jgi:arylsulfatase A-like enzyme
VEALLFQFRDWIHSHLPAQKLSLVPGWYSPYLFPQDLNASTWAEQIVRGYHGGPRSSLFLSEVLDRLLQAVYEEHAGPYDEFFPRGLPAAVKTRFILEHAVDWIQREIQEVPRPFLGYFHLYPPHAPYNTRREFVDRFTEGWTPPTKPTHFFTDGTAAPDLIEHRRDYDEYIAYADAEFGRLCDFLEQAGFLENTYVVFTSDHGEMFERGIWRHNTPTLYEPLIRVPLLISEPGRRRRRDVHQLTSAVDLAPTLLQIAGLPMPNWSEGRVLPLFEVQEGSPERSVFALEAKGNGKTGPLTQATAAIVRGSYKLIHYFGYEGFDGVYELYDVVGDPEELEDIQSSKPDVASELRLELARKLGIVDQAG